MNLNNLSKQQAEDEIENLLKERARINRAVRKLASADPDDMSAIELHTSLMSRASETFEEVSLLEAHIRRLGS